MTMGVAGGAEVVRASWIYACPIRAVKKLACLLAATGMLPSPLDRRPLDSVRKRREVIREIFVNPEAVATVWAHDLEGTLAEGLRDTNALVADVVSSVGQAAGLLAYREPPEMN